MPSTHVSLYYHLIFSTKGRIPWIKESWETRLHGYMGGILRGMGAVAEAIGGIADHVHIAVGLKATHCVADILQDLKANSSGWVHREIGCRLFGWQEGYGAFTVSPSNLNKVKKYILGQKEHHAKKTFQEEYRELLLQSGIEFDERYLW
jgi:putative transposase